LRLGEGIRVREHSPNSLPTRQLGYYSGQLSPVGVAAWRGFN